MKKASKWLAIMIAIIMVASIALVGCNTSDKEETPTPGTTEQEPPKDVQELHLYTTDEPLLDPQAAQYSLSFEIMNNIYEGLLRVGPDQSYQPAMAESYEHSEDGLVWTFHLRDAKWSDGSAVTADDFVFGLERAVSEELGSIYAFIVSDYVAEAVAVDAKTLQITLKNPTPYVDSLTAFATYYPVKKEFVESKGESFGKDVDAMLYNGPFTVTSWAHDQKLVLEKNPNYWDKDTVKLEKITLDIIKDSNAALNLYLAGDIDRVALSGENVNIYKTDANYQTEPDPVLFWLLLNNRNSVLQNKNIRKALSFGFDRQSYVDIILNNGSIAAYSFVPPGMPGPEGKTFRQVNGDLVSYDLAKAEEFLAAGLKELNLEKLPSLLYLGYDSDTGIKGAEFVQDMYRKMGIDITIENLPVAAVKEKRKAGEFDLFFGGWGPDYWDPMTFMDLFITDGPFNEGKWSNATYDEIIAFAKTTPDFVTRMERLLEGEKILIQEEAGIVPVFFRSRARLVQPYIKDFVTHKFGADSSWKWAYIEGKAK